MSDRGNDSGARKSGIGARLQAARERADLSVPKAAELLHVDPAVLQALEAENFAALGAPVYVRGHLRHYTELVKESVPELLALYGNSVNAGPPPDLTRMPHARPADSGRSALLTGGIAVLIGVGLIGSVRWIYLDLHPATPARPVAAAPASPVPAAAAPDAQPAADGGGASAPQGESVPVDAPSSAARALSPHAARGARAPATVADASITLRFRGACWTEVYDARGEALFRAIGAEGDVQTLHGPAPLKVMIGNFAVVDVDIAGQAQVIPVEAKSGRVAQFLVTHDGTLQAVQHTTTAGNNS